MLLRIAAWGTAIYGVVALWITAWTAYRIRTSPPVQSKTALALDTPLSEPVTRLVRRAEEWGFSLCDVLEVHLAGRQMRAVVLKNSDGTVFFSLSEISDDLVLGQFETWWQGHKVLLTRWPVGESIEQPDLISHFAQGSLQAAHDYHMNRLALLYVTWGMPMTFENNAAMESVERYYHEHFLRRDTIRLFRAAVWLTLANALVLMLAIVSALVLVSDTPTTDVAGLVILCLSILLAVVSVQRYQRTVKRPAQPIDEQIPPLTVL